jgi:hypothetical protein
LVSIWQTTQPYLSVAWRGSAIPVSISFAKIRETVRLMTELGAPFDGSWRVTRWDSPQGESDEFDGLMDDRLEELLLLGVDRNHDGAPHQAGGYTMSMTNQPTGGVSATLQLSIGAESDRADSDSLTVSLRAVGEETTIDLSASLGAVGRDVLGALVVLWGASEGVLGVTKANRAQRRFTSRLGLITFMAAYALPFSETMLPAGVDVSTDDNGLWVQVGSGTLDAAAVSESIVEASRAIETAGGLRKR